MRTLFRQAALLLPLSLLSAVAFSSPVTEILDVAVIGSGPGGLSCALATSEVFDNVAVFERASSFRPIGAALGLDDFGYAALGEWGDVAERVRSKGANPDWHILQRPDGEILFDDESVFAGTSFTWLGWYSLQTTLRDCLPQHVTIHLNHRLVGFSDDKKSGLVRLDFELGDASAKSIYTRLLVGADGYHSVVRQGCVKDGEPLYTGTMTWRGVLDRKSMPNLGRPFDVESENGNLSIIGDTKNFWVMDCGNGQLAWAGTALQESSEKSKLSAKQTALEAFDQWPSIVERLIQATDEVVETGVFDRDPVDSWGSDSYQRVTLLGDAAHPMRPSLGLGATMAFQDSLSLAKKLTNVKLDDSKSVSNALLKYEQERIAVTAPLQQKARAEGESTHAVGRADQLKQGFDVMLAKKRDTREKVEL